MGDPGTTTTTVANGCHGRLEQYIYQRRSSASSSTTTHLQQHDMMMENNVLPAESISARASLDDTTTMRCDEDGGPITKMNSNDSDTQSVMTNFSVSNYHSLNRVIAQLRGETIKSVNTEYWMPDEQCKECFDCNARFKFYRRKHHCRICGMCGLECIKEQRH